MDKSTAQAIHELATAGRLSDESQTVISDALNLPTFDGQDPDGNDVRPEGLVRSAARGSSGSTSK